MLQFGQFRAEPFLDVAAAQRDQQISLCLGRGSLRGACRSDPRFEFDNPPRILQPELGGGLLQRPRGQYPLFLGPLQQLALPVHAGDFLREALAQLLARVFPNLLRQYALFLFDPREAGQ